MLASTIPCASEFRSNSHQSPHSYVVDLRACTLIALKRSASSKTRTHYRGLTYLDSHNPEEVSFKQNSHLVRGGLAYLHSQNSGEVIFERFNYQNRIYFATD